MSNETSTVGRDDRDYKAFEAQVRATFATRVASGPLFTTDASALFEAYLDAVPDRQGHNCYACRRFLEIYSGLVVIDDAGAASPAFWEDNADVPACYRPAVGALARLVRKAGVTGVFGSSAPVWGHPITGAWPHLSAIPPASLVHHSLLLTAGQAMAAKLEDYRTVCRALVEFSPAHVDAAMKILKSEAMYRGEKVLGPVEWLRDLHAARGRARASARDNVAWRAVATAPAGFCHPRSSMAGTLLEDIAAGMGFDEVSRRFAARMHPLKYQRPQAAPSAGNIAEAEKVVAKLGIAPSLARRFARLDEVEALWKPTPPEADAPASGVFSHLKRKGEAASPAISPPPSVMTWDKFTRTVLPSAESIEVYVKQGADNFAALVTADDPSAPPIHQWDREDRRNPVSWYVYHGGSPPSQWGLVPGRFHEVTAVTLGPAQWGGDPEAFPHQGRNVIFILDGAKDSREAGLAIFPETLRAELHAIRSTIEAFSRAGKIGGREEASACGLLLARSSKWDAQVRVHSAGSYMDYQLDRWD